MSPSAGRWFRANLHFHSMEHSPCARVPLVEAVEMYRDRGTQVLAVTDHDHVTDLAELRQRFPDMTLLEGFEHSKAENLLFVGQEVPPLHRLSLDRALRDADGLLTVVCHPTPRKGEVYWPAEKILALDPVPIGVEVYNGHYSESTGARRDPNPLYTEVWDELLSRGARIWGFANDDFHYRSDLGRAFNMILAGDPKPGTIIRALKEGRFYASTGLLLSEMSFAHGSIRVRLEEKARGRFVGPGGSVLEEGQGELFHHTIDRVRYVRFEAEGSAGRIFLQPFFPER